jgi:hypothetical protein
MDTQLTLLAGLGLLLGVFLLIVIVLWLPNDADSSVEPRSEPSNPRGGR